MLVHQLINGYVLTGMVLLTEMFGANIDRRVFCLQKSMPSNVLSIAESGSLALVIKYKSFFVSIMFLFQAYRS